MDLKVAINRIKAEKRQGDIEKVCRRVGFSRTVYDTAVTRDNITDLTEAEYKVIVSFVKFLDNRLKKRTSELAGYVNGSGTQD